MRKQILKTFFLLAAFMVLPSFVFSATPTISNVTGTVATGQTLTITGTNMVQEDTTNWFRPLNVARAAGASPAADGWTQAGDTSRGGATYVTSPNLIGSHAINFEFHSTGAPISPPPAGEYLIDYNMPNNEPLVYARAYVRYAANNFGTTGLFQNTSHVKMYYWMGGTADYVQFLFPAVHPTQIGIKLSGGSLVGYNLLSPIQPDRWYCIEAMSHYDTANSAVTSSVWVDNQLMGTNSMSFSAWSSLNGGNVPADPFYFLLGYTNVAQDGSIPTGSFDMYTSDFMEARTRIRPASIIEISGDGGLTWRYQPPTYLSDTSSTINADLPTLISRNFLLRVTNNGQTTSSSYNLSGSSNTTPPAAPRGLGVQ